MEIFLEISIIVVVAALVSGLMRLLRQPIIIGYIITGLLLGPYSLDLIHSEASLEALSKFGISLLLFIVGLHLSPKAIKELGQAAFKLGFGQVIITSVTGTLLALVMGYNGVESFYIAVALTFSSTIIILKLLSDKGDMEKLYAKLSVGVLLIQDFIAFLILIFVPIVSQGDAALSVLGILLLKGVAVSIALYLISRFVLFRATTFFAKSQEFLFIFSLAWGMGLAVLFEVMGFSIEIGALVAGVCLSILPYNDEISSRMRPLRDFFLIIFFINLGSQLNLGSILPAIPHVIIFSIFVLIFNPIIMIILLKYLGYGRRVSFLSALTVSQISEFSLIVIGLGVRGGFLDNEILSRVTLVGMISIALSSYMILYSEKIYPYVKAYLKIFDNKRKTQPIETFADYDVILFGYNRVGYDFGEILKAKKYKFLVIDFNPETIALLKKKKFEFKYGDAEDGDFLDTLGLDKAKMIISTVPDTMTNVYLLNKVRLVNKSAVTIIVAQNSEAAYELYEAGANYVIMPYLLGARYASKLIDDYGFDLNSFEKEKLFHLEQLKNRDEIWSLESNQKSKN